MTGKQIKRQLKKYLVDTKVEFIDNYRGFQIGNFRIVFTIDDYVVIFLPSSPLGIDCIQLYYESPQNVFAKIVSYHMRIHGRGLRIQGRVRTLHTGKRQQFIFK